MPITITSCFRLAKLGHRQLDWDTALSLPVEKLSGTAHSTYHDKATPGPASFERRCRLMSGVERDGASGSRLLDPRRRSRRVERFMTVCGTANSKTCGQSNSMRRHPCPERWGIAPRDDQVRVAAHRSCPARAPTLMKSLSYSTRLLAVYNLHRLLHCVCVSFHHGHLVLLCASQGSANDATQGCAESTRQCGREHLELSNCRSESDFAPGTSPPSGRLGRGTQQCHGQLAFETTGRNGLDPR